MKKTAYRFYWEVGNVNNRTLEGLALIIADDIVQALNAFIVAFPGLPADHIKNIETLTDHQVVIA